MIVDYDLVILGGAFQGRSAAAIATRQGARVALVEPPGQVEAAIAQQTWMQALTHAAQRAKQQRLWGEPTPALASIWVDLGQKARIATTIAQADLALDTLAASGVDVVSELGYFAPKPRLQVATPQRNLRARGYVLCPAVSAKIPAIPGLAQTPYWTLADLRSQPTPPPRLAILGRSPEALGVAQSLALLGVAVTLISRGDRLLSTEDEDISRYIETLLAAAGVTLHLSARPNRIDYSSGFQITFTNQDPLQADHLLVATAFEPQMTELNLPAIGLRSPSPALPVDDRLNTAHPRVFVCGPALGGYWATTTDQQDVSLAVANALYLPYRRLNRLQRPGLLPTVPPFARLGLTATQGQWGFGPAAQVLQVSLETALSAHLEGDITGLARWVVHQDGRILGAQICSPQAADLIQTTALLMRHNVGMAKLGQLGPLPHSELLHHLATAWQTARWQPGTWRRDWAENWFNWRRSR